MKKTRSYGRGDMHEDPTRCIERVHSREARSFYIYQCKRKRVKDEYCKQHHPETKLKRDAEQKARWTKERENSPFKKLERIKVRLKKVEWALRNLIDSGLNHCVSGICDKCELCKAKKIIGKPG